jgi:hypothetical protein
MRTFRVELLERVGELRFGMARDDVRKALGEYKEFKKTKLSKNTTDDFSFCHAFYDGQNKLEALEFFPGMDVKLALNSIGVFELEYGKLLDYVKGFDPNVEVAADGFTSKEGISVYAPQGETETVLFSAAGYWD